MQPIPQVRPAALADWFASQAGTPLLLDVREPWEVQQARPAEGAGFEYRAVPMGEVPARLAELADAASGRPVACLCHHGARSQRVAAFLQQQGFGAVANVAGGIDAWSVELDPAVARY